MVGVVEESGFRVVTLRLVYDNIIEVYSAAHIYLYAEALIEGALYAFILSNGLMVIAFGQGRNALYDTIEVYIAELSTYLAAYAVSTFENAAHMKIIFSCIHIPYLLFFTVDITFIESHDYRDTKLQQLCGKEQASA